MARPEQACLPGMAPTSHDRGEKNDASTRPVTATSGTVAGAANEQSEPRTTPRRPTGGEVMTPLGAFRVGSVPLLKGTDDCPGCGAPKVRPRPAFPGVKWCFGCGRQFDASTLEEIDPVRGPAALADEGEILAPHTGAEPPMDAAHEPSALQEGAPLLAAGPRATRPVPPMPRPFLWWKEAV